MTLIHPAALLLSLFIHAGDVTIPLINRPSNFSGAAGSYRIAVEAAPTAVRVEDPITLSVKIISLQPGPWPHPPQRDKLQLLPAELDAQFFVEPLPEEDLFLAGENAWLFRWRLVPKHAGAQAIPALEFVYYHTAGSPAFKAAEGALSIDLDVKPRPAISLNAAAGIGAKFEQIVEGDALLTRSPEPWMHKVEICGALALPPFLCLAGYAAWRRLFPETAERLRRHRGKALRMALGRLRKLGPSASPALLRAVVADYLRLHVDLPEGGPTAKELKETLLRHGLAPKLASAAEVFFQHCDAALFAPSATVSTANLRTDATHLLPMLEAVLCALASR